VFSTGCQSFCISDWLSCFRSKKTKPGVPIVVIFHQQVGENRDSGLLNGYRSRSDNDVAVGIGEVGCFIAPVAKRQWTQFASACFFQTRD